VGFSGVLFVILECLKGRDVCKILGFRDAGSTLLKQVKPAFKTNLKSMRVSNTVELSDIASPYRNGKTAEKK